MIDFLIILPGILMAISIHEFGHGYAAYILGDDTAKKSGRLSLNPLKHIDPIGFLMLIIVHFGWAKPVPINSNRFKHKRIGLFLVSIAGVICNIILAIICIYLYKYELRYVNMYALNSIILSAVSINIGFAVFNLLPIPPLDGSKIILSILPNRLHYYYFKYEYIGSIILIVLMFTDNIRIVTSPIYNVINNLINIIL
ncbi:site-2 protease family protein [Tepidibacter hydrothermalis]|uniref:Site-2 protease family protein n=1 Tax=Tepidibacter hydrothermalis TaxID=3036126 RepID=A0ABY8E7D6_9FIRM|nr:site-2 protease family protein [Tepidibacter hydrothermalis]WFD08797.1 site-2 protease family protein [Tepidibacter hydrothermalis]